MAQLQMLHSDSLDQLLVGSIVFIWFQYSPKPYDAKAKLMGGDFT